MFTNDDGSPMHGHIPAEQPKLKPPDDSPKYLEDDFPGVGKQASRATGRMPEQAQPAFSPG